MISISEIIKLIREDEKVKKRVILVTVLAIVFALALFLKPSDFKGKYITNKTGNVIGIQRGSLKSQEKYNLKLSVISDGEKSERSLVINKQASNKGANNESKENNAEAERENEINSIITDIEMSDKKVIKFPAKLSDGTILIWNVERESGSKYLAIPFVYLLLILLVVKGSNSNEKNEEDDKRKDIVKCLPRFTNQLLLMMNAGMILSDAFEKISNSYKLIHKEERGYFESELVEIAEKNKDHRVSTAVLINEWANKHNVKELMRISTILTENERRGSNVIDNLSRESKYLWDDRKIIARESGKMIDTKMSYPMGLLLLLLIVITMAPALLNL